MQSVCEARYTKQYIHVGGTAYANPNPAHVQISDCNIGLMMARILSPKLNHLSCDRRSSSLCETNVLLMLKFSNVYGSR